MLAQAPNRDPVHEVLSVQVSNYLSQRVRSPDFDVTIRTQKKKAFVASVPHQVLEQLEARLIGPMQVIEQERDGRRLADLLQEGRYCAEQPLLVELIARPRQCFEPHLVGQKLRQMGPGGRCGISDGRRRNPIQCRERLHERVEGNGLLRLVASSGRNQESSIPHRQHRFLRQPGFPHPRLSAEQHETATATGRRIDALQYRGQLLVASHNGTGRKRSKKAADW